MTAIGLRHFTPPARQHTEHGAVVCTDYHPPRVLENARAVTCRGIVIGGAIGPTVPTMTQDGELIQAALLDKSTAAPTPLRLRAWRLFAGWGWVLVLIALFLLAGCQSDIDDAIAVQADLADAIAQAGKGEAP